MLEDPEGGSPEPLEAGDILLLANLVRLFQDKLGISASESLTDIRMTMSANELRKTSISTGAIAEAVGYPSEAAFQRAFKQHMGSRQRVGESQPRRKRALSRHGIKVLARATQAIAMPHGVRRAPPDSPPASRPAAATAHR